MQTDSPEQQKKAILGYAHDNGYHITEWFVDFGKSGTTFDQRPEFRRLRSIVEDRPQFEAVICYDESRWGRAIDPEENTFMRVLFRRRNVEVLLVKTSVDRNNEFAPMFSAMEGVQASQYSKKLSELILRGAKSNASYSNGGTAPYGYNRCAVNTRTGAQRILQDGEWCISGQEKVSWIIGEDSEVAIVRHIFEQRAKGLACVLIAKDLNHRLVPCPRRGRWKNSDQKWSAGTIDSIVKNPAYHGARVYNKNSMSKIVAKQQGRDLKHSVSYPHWRNDESEWIIAEAAHEPIVGPDLWKKANAQRRPVTQRMPRATAYTSDFLLTGLIRCSRCGHPFQGWTNRAKGHVYRKYVDGGWNNKRVCEFFGIPKEKIEKFALDSIREVLSELSTISRIEERLESLLNSRPDAVAAEGQTLAKALEKNAKAIRNMTQAIERGAGLESLLERLEELEKERKALVTKQQTLQAESSTQISAAEVSSQVAAFVLNFDREFERAPIQERKLLIQRCISEIIVDRDKSVARFHVRRIPAIVPQIQVHPHKKRLPTEVVGNRSSGGANFQLLTTSKRVFCFAIGPPHTS